MLYCQKMSNFPKKGKFEWIRAIGVTKISKSIFAINKKKDMNVENCNKYHVHGFLRKNWYINMYLSKTNKTRKIDQRGVVFHHTNPHGKKQNTPWRTIKRWKSDAFAQQIGGWNWQVRSFKKIEWEVGTSKPILVFRRSLSASFGRRFAIVGVCQRGCFTSTCFGLFAGWKYTQLTL